MTKYYLLFDTSNMFHRSFGIYNYQIKDFSLDNEEHRNMLIRKFVIDCVSIANKINIAGLFFCFDKHSFRKQVDKTYKGNRTKKDDSFYKTLDELYDLLIFKNLNALRVDNLEADDLIALTCEKLEHLPKIIVSGDTDVQQLIRPRTYVLTPHTKTRTLYRSLYSVHPPEIEGAELDTIHPQYILSEKLLKGCKGDNVSSLVKKGFRTQRIKDFADEYNKQKMNHADTEFNSFKFAIQQQKLEITDEQLHNQLQLVCLQSQFMPQELVLEFDKIKFKLNTPVDLEVSSILRNTKYWDDSYTKKP